MPVYQSIYDGPPRNYGGNKTAKKWIVIHNTSNDAPAVNEASYAKRRTDSVSSHYYVDDERIIQSLNTDYRAFHVGSSTGNSGGIAYEITGVNSKSRSWWLANVRWDLLAAQIRKDCAAHKITPRLLSVADIRAGKTGLMTHDQARQAWGGTTHTDPGPNFPMDHLLTLVKNEEDDMPLSDADVNKVAAAAALKTWQYKNKAVTDRDAYAHLRNADGLAVVKQQNEAILAKLAGADTKTILDAINKRASEDLARDAALLAELQDLASGGATADQIVDKLAERLGAGE